MIDDALYEQWLRFLFDHPDTEDLFGLDETELATTDEQKVILIGKTFAQSGKDLAKYTDIQVNKGLNYVFNPSFSDMCFLLCQKGVAEDLRIRTVLSIKELYHDCFFNRCTKNLSHLDEPNTGALNSICYMLWDISPLTSWKSVVVDVMEAALYIPHIACIESALHGLGHRYSQDPARVMGTIDSFLLKTKGLRPELKHYAENARIGYIQ